MNQQIEQISKRTLRYFYEDGLPEIGAGLILGLLGIYFYIQATQPEGSALRAITDSGLILVIIIGGFFIRRLVTRAKTRITYPRTGYVEYHQDRLRNRRPRILALAAIAMTVAVMVVFIGGLLRETAWMPVFTGFFFSAITIFIMIPRVGLTRWYILAAISALLGIGLGLSGIDNTLGLGAFYPGLGLCTTMSGILVLIHYLRTTQPPEINSDE
jgi:hypothetical protein